MHIFLFLFHSIRFILYIKPIFKPFILFLCRCHQILVLFKHLICCSKYIKYSIWISILRWKKWWLFCKYSFIIYKKKVLNELQQWSILNLIYSKLHNFFSQPISWNNFHFYSKKIQCFWFNWLISIFYIYHLIISSQIISSQKITRLEFVYV